jgi:hypothetical protein
MNNTVRVEVNEPTFDFEDGIYTPFDLDTTKIRYIITKIEKNTAHISLECSGFCIGKIQIPSKFISKLSDCKISRMEFSSPK